MMPRLTIKEILEKLKEKNLNPKIILLTVINFSDEEKGIVHKIGNIVDYITKPFEVDDVINSVKKHL